MSEERPELSRKLRTSGKSFYSLVSAKSGHVSHWSRDSETAGFFDFANILRLSLSRRNTQIIDKITNFWRLVFASINCLLATLCNSLITIRENHWLLRIVWSFSESVSEYKSVSNMCLYNNSWIIKSMRKQYCANFWVNYLR